MTDKKDPRPTVRIPPASPLSLVQEIPTPDTCQVVEPPTGETAVLREQGRGAILSDVLGSYTGTPADREQPEQDADDL